VLVTEWVEGMSFEQVASEPEPVRDRYAEIVYRFFYVTAGELHVALGDPHPGNYLLCDDGRVAFFDFGMVRELPRDYLAREALVFRAIREGDAPALVTAMRNLGYLPGLQAEWNGELLVEHMRRAGWWFADDEPIRLAPDDLWRGTESLREESGELMIEQMRRMTLPPEALLLRRMEGLLFQIASTVRAEAAWGPLLGELVGGDPPVGELGRAHADWLAARPRGGTR
jgi:predicted unusual protein kinase regulating ubiquinone biosynthesis (AarF/ABC1/UbiB family)